MTANLDDARLHECIFALRKRSFIDWARLDYDSKIKDKIIYGASGADGLAGLRQHLLDELAHFCFLIVEQQHVLMVTYLPATLNGVKRAKAVVNARQIASLLEHTASLTINSLDELSTDTIRAKLKLAPLSQPSDGTPAHLSVPAPSKESAQTNSVAATSNSGEKVQPNHLSLPSAPVVLPTELGHTGGAAEYTTNSASPLPSPIALPVQPTEYPLSETASSSAVKNLPVEPVQPLERDLRTSDPIPVRDPSLSAAENVKLNYEEQEESPPKVHQRTSSLNTSLRHVASASSPPSSPVSVHSKRFSNEPLTPRSASMREQRLRELREVEEARKRRSGSINSSNRHSSEEHDYSAQHVQQAKQAEEKARQQWQDQGAERSRLDAIEQQRLERQEAERREASERLRKEEEWRAQNLRRQEEEELARTRKAEEEAVQLEKAEAARLEAEKKAEEERQQRAEALRLQALAKEQEFERMKQDFARLSASGDVILNGFVSVQGGSSIIWKRRWFELSRGSLVLFKSQTDKSKAMEQISIQAARQPHVSNAEEETMLPHSFKINYGSSDEDDAYLFYCDEKRDKDLLLAALTEAIK